MKEYRLRTVAAGIRATIMVVGILAVYPLLPDVPPVQAVPYAVLLAVAAVGALGVALLPWRWLFDRGLADLAFYAWSGLDIVLITALAAVSGGPESPIVFLYALTTVFFAAGGYPGTSQAVLLAVTAALYVGLVGWTGWQTSPAVVLLVVGTLTVVAYLTSFLGRELRHEAETAAAALADSERRAQLLATVATAGRHLVSLQPQAVLDAMVDAVIALGWDVSSLCLLDEDGTTYRVAYGRGLPLGYVGTVQPRDRGFVGMVLARSAPVLVDDYTNHPQSVSELRPSGIHATLGVPVWLRDELAGTLVGGSKADRAIRAEDVEAMELLAAQAGFALDNARLHEQEMDAARERAQLEQMKNEFLEGSSHELRTPLAIIKGMGSTLEDRWAELSDQEARDLVTRINVHAESLNRVLSNLTDFSRLQSGVLGANLVRVPLTAVTEAAVARTQGALADHHVTVDVESGVEVDMDGELIVRALENLLLNVASHTPAGTAVRLQAARDGESWARFSVSDDGPGILPQELARLGEGFFRGGSADERAAGGLGLGLALVRQVLKLHGSELAVESASGAGSTFSFRLPVQPEHGPS